MSYYIFHEGTHPVYRKKKKGCAEGEFVINRKQPRQEVLDGNEKLSGISRRIVPDHRKAATEIINLQSVINLPKGTEHFLSDIHGEYEAFSHVLRNGSGAVRRRLTMSSATRSAFRKKRALATLIYYPRERLEMEKKQQEDIDDWYKVMLYRLIDVCKSFLPIHPRQSAESLPADYGYIIEELITEKPEVLDKEAYYEAIIQTILEIGSAETSSSPWQS